VGEHDLMPERGLATPGPTRNQVEGELRDSSAEHVVEPVHSSGQLPNSDWGLHSSSSSCALAAGAGRSPPTTFAVNPSPMNLLSRSRNVAKRTIAVSVAVASSWADRHSRNRVP